MVPKSKAKPDKGSRANSNQSSMMFLEQVDEDMGIVTQAVPAYKSKPMKKEGLTSSSRVSNYETKSNLNS